jgi:transcription elongation factor GreA
MTTLGEKLLVEELHRLKTKDRPKVIDAISRAREHGDLKENAEYHAAREEQGFIEGRIQEIDAKLSNSQVIDLTTIENNGRVIFGSTVRLSCVETDEEVQYTIVGEDESDIRAMKISYTSPIARALIGKEEDDVVTVRAPKGDIDYEIIAVTYL